MKNNFFSCLFTGIVGWLIFLDSNTIAQVKIPIGRVSGRIYDLQKRPVDYATISLLRLADTSLVRTALTDSVGAYFFENIMSGDYLISVSSMGYKKEFSRPFGVTEANASNIVEDILIIADSKSLKGVDIVAKRPFIEQRIDKIVLNVENSILASGNTALEVLEKAPGITIDRQNDLIKLKNQSGVLIMIDGKRSFLSDADLSNMLRNMTSDQIGTIEIITNPSSKYDAAGNSGIINIKLKKTRLLGTNGSISSTIGESFFKNAPNDLYRASLNLNLNHKTEKWNIYGNMGGFRNSNFSTTQLYRNVQNGDVYSYFDQKFKTPQLGTGFSGKIGVDFFKSEKTTFGLMLDGNISKGKRDQFSNTTINQVQSGITTPSTLVQKSNSSSPRNSFSINFNIKHDFNKKGTELTFDADYANFRNENTQNFTSEYLDIQPNLSDNSLQRNFALSKIRIYGSRIDLTLPLDDKLKLETGLKTSFVVTDNDFLAEQFLSGAWQNDLNKSNLFVYNENVNAAYFNLGKNWGKWEAQVGLRVEYTHSKGNSVSTNSIVNRNYVSLFPTLFLSQVINDNNSLRYSFSRRIGRPNYQQLNPFVIFLDPFTFNEGNPFLKPQFTNNFELSYIYKSSVSLSLGYSNTSDYIVQLTQQDNSTKIVKNIQQNFGQFKNYSLNLSLPIPIADWWTTQNQISGYYKEFSDTKLFNNQFNTNNFNFSFNAFNSFVLSKGWSSELSFRYDSPFVNGVERTTKSQYGVDIGIQKTFMAKSARIKLNVNDVFFNNRYIGEIKYENVNLSVLNKWDSRRVSLTFSYNFGNQNVKAYRNRESGTEELKNRTQVKN